MSESAAEKALAASFQAQATQFQRVADQSRQLASAADAQVAMNAQAVSDAQLVLAPESAATIMDVTALSAASPSTPRSQVAASAAGDSVTTPASANMRDHYQKIAAFADRMAARAQKVAALHEQRAALLQARSF